MLSLAESLPGLAQGPSGRVSSWVLAFLPVPSQCDIQAGSPEPLAQQSEPPAFPQEPLGLHQAALSGRWHPFPPSPAPQLLCKERGWGTWWSTPPPPSISACFSLAHRHSPVD